MKQFPLLFALLTIATAQVSGVFAQPRSIAAHSVERGIVAITEVAEPYLLDGENAVELDLPWGARVSAVEALAEGWIVTGTTSDAESQSLFLLLKSGALVESVALPAGVGKFAAAPVPLIESGGLAGLAWLEGDRYDAYAVRSATWDGKHWSEAETVSEADLASQLALSGAVLSDGSWVLAWSAVEDGDDDLFWARREVDGTWIGRQRLTSDNRVPDIHPTVLAQPAGGALVSWSWFDGSDYRVRLTGLGSDGWEDLDFLRPAGSTRPSLLAGDKSAYLLYRRVVPDSWVVEELDATGRAWRSVVASSPSVNPPVISVDESGVAFSWPAPTSQRESRDEVVSESVTVPWSVSSDASREDESQSLHSFPPPSMAEPGAVVYRAFGDSIMRAASDPIFLPGNIVFDVADDGEGGSGGPACAPNGDPFAILCGVNWRLETTLDLVFATDVANDGKGGEETPAGVTRIESVLANGGDVVLLMEATNDITPAGTSNETILDNLEIMIDKATAAGFDTGVASVIKRRTVDMGVVVSDPANDMQTEDLRNSIKNDLGPSKNRVHIDGWETVNPALGQTDYWNTNQDCCGHPDKSGYDKLEPKFRNAILADPVLAAPVLIGPSGNTGLSPTFTWNTSGNARLYQLAVTGPGGSTTWWDALAPPMPPITPPPGVNYANCSGGTCSANLGKLAAGNHTWKVRGKNLRGPSLFSADQAFDVCGGLPASITLDSHDTGSETYHACPGPVTSETGFVVASSETVTLWGETSVVIEEIVVQVGATMTLRSD